jgi:hypothetical protein
MIERRYADPQEHEDFAVYNIPSRYFGGPDNLTALSVFLCSPLARDITGDLFQLDVFIKRVAH